MAEPQRAPRWDPPTITEAVATTRVEFRPSRWLREDALMRTASQPWSPAAISVRFVARVVRLLCARAWAASARVVSEKLGVDASYAELCDACWSGAAETSEGTAIRSRRLHSSGIYVVWVGE